MNSLFFLCSLRSGIRGPVLSKQAFIFFSHTFLFTFNYLPNHEWCFSLRRSRWKYYFALVFLLFVLMVLMLSMPLLITTKYSRRLLGFFLLFLSLSLTKWEKENCSNEIQSVCMHEESKDDSLIIFLFPRSNFWVSSVFAGCSSMKCSWSWSKSMHKADHKHLPQTSSILVLFLSLLMLNSSFTCSWQCKIILYGSRLWYLFPSLPLTQIHQLFFS